MPRNKRNTRRKHRGGYGEGGIDTQPTTNQADDMVNNLGSSASTMGSNALESTKSATANVGNSVGNMADSIATKSSDTLGKAKNWFSGFFSSSPDPGTSVVGGRRSRRRRGGIGSHWGSKSHPLYLNPSANATGNNIYNLSKGGSVQPYGSIESTPANADSSYLLNGGKRRRTHKRRKSSRKSRRGRK